MRVSLTGVSLHVKDIQKAKEFYLRVPGASLEHERAISLPLSGSARGRANLVRVNREEKFHLEFGSVDLDSLPQSLIRQQYIARAAAIPVGPNRSLHARFGR
jgi:catechol 2,3-dioxygenase-like lactoylglutathione lyase family enzyme